jgi:hypothetical protein
MDLFYPQSAEDAARAYDAIASTLGRPINFPPPPAQATVKTKKKRR